MLRTIDFRRTFPQPHELHAALPRPAVDVSAALATAAELIDDVRDRGEPALREQSARFDGAEPATVRVGAAELNTALTGLDPAVREALELMIARVRKASAAQVPPPKTTTLAPGAVVVQRWQPVDRVGLYVPGGKAVYPSSVVMNVVAAQAAAVPSIAIASPPQRAFGGGVHPTILGAAALLGVDEVYAMGGAGAIGAFAHGVPAIGLGKVDVITGPGNIYVAAAKRVVQSLVGIDAEAGPTEILVIADESADIEAVASDLVSQAEHDEMAASVLVTTAPDAWVERVRAATLRRAKATRHADRVAAALGGPQSAIVRVGDLGQAALISNAYAPEHLELQTSDDDALLTGITNAGAIFVGRDSPVSLGDYVAGSNHVLPTGGQSAHTAGLGAHTFLRPQQIIRYDAAALAEVAPQLVALAAAEDLPAHGEAAKARAR
ncbi:histidinol dehydrogenase [Pseudoclavibacter endophyticus]|uniref:Histidinol dehydrogenase n=1 Tax=Pseudoclavibacter endophyticus TaxID=1778590 RepID=A0A6H9WVP4_9MICO|nr:histidinol dehydrogenase [Pseudoclavibacter endophyticus]KAB1650240.1 histidinol dehydrogenase [Pseudoclavibacter endophyticus]GGA55933.1 histidinol dehydrogenase [Pseudoclavibacter endophyticus]